MMPRSHEANYNGYCAFWNKPIPCVFTSTVTGLLTGLICTDITNNLMKGIFFIGWVATFAYTAKKCVNERAEEDMIRIRYGVLPQMRP